MSVHPGACRCPTALPAGALAALLLAIGGASACVAAGSGQTQSLQRLPAAAIPFARNSTAVEPLTTVVRDAVTWSALWNRLAANMRPAPPVPVTDFGHWMIVVTASGRQRSGGHEVSVVSATTDTAGISVQVTATAPGRGCIVSSVLSSPVDFALIPRSEAAVRFEWTRVTRDCAR